MNTLKKVESFLLLGNMDKEIFSSLKQKVESFSDDQWRAFKEKNFMKSQPDSQSMILLSVKDSTSALPLYRDHGVDNTELQELFASELAHIYTLISNFFGEEDHGPLRVQLVKLPSRRNVFPHVDPGHIFSVSRRIHVPIITNTDVHFFVNLDKIPMEEGTLFEINNQSIHCVFNQSDLDRVHLIVDWGHKDFGSK